MPEQSKDSVCQKQKSARPKIEDSLGDVLDGEGLKHALGFITYLRANKMSPVWASPNSWKVSYKSNGVCYIKLENGSWHINFHGSFKKDYESIFTDGKIKETAWANVKYCVRCNANCIAAQKWVRASVLGKEFDNVCKNIRIVMSNPDAEAIECAEKLVEKNREDIINGKPVW